MRADCMERERRCMQPSRPPSHPSHSPASSPLVGWQKGLRCFAVLVWDPPPRPPLMRTTHVCLLTASTTATHAAGQSAPSLHMRTVIVCPVSGKDVPNEGAISTTHGTVTHRLGWALRLRRCWGLSGSRWLPPPRSLTGKGDGLAPGGERDRCTWTGGS